jgi:hypothetical protein
MLMTKYEAAIADFQMMRQTARALGNRHKEGESLGHLVYVHWLTFSEAHTPSSNNMPRRRFSWPVKPEITKPWPGASSIWDR